MTSLNPSGWSHRLVLISLLCASAVMQANAQVASTPSVDAHILLTGGASSIRVDGLLDEAAWRDAPIASGFRQQEPFEGEPATEITEVQVLFDDATLYVGVMARDRSPEEVIARILQRDKLMEVTDDEGKPEFTSDDAVVIVLDPFHDHRNAVVLGTNPNGAEFDALITDEGREFNVDWRGVWEVAARRTPAGWSAEFAIPFRSLRFPETSDEPWGFNIYRVIRRKNEQTLWSSWSRSNEGFTRVSRAGHIHGLTNLPRTGLNVELKPYVLAGSIQEPDLFDHLDADEQLEIGLDAKYEVRPGLVLDATLNTDFAQVEVDDQQVNLTRFSLFYPEKRDFFLENGGIFEMGWRSMYEPPPFLLFFSRRIGISEDGPIPVLGGLRLTGRTGDQTVGFVNVVMDEALGEPRQNHAVARLKRDIGDNSYVGAMVTDRREVGDWNTTGGVDWSFWPTSVLNVQGFAAATAASGVGGEGAAYRLGIDYQTDRLGITAGQLGVGPDATADLGFITRKDIQRSDTFLRFTPRPKFLGLRKLNLFWNSKVFTSFDGALRDWETGLAFEPEWNTGDEFAFAFMRGFNRLDEPFDISENVTIPVGDYDANQIMLFANTSRNRPIMLNSMAFLQSYFDGHIRMITNDVTASPNANTALTLGFTHNRVDVPAGAFTANLARLRVGYAFSTKLVANTLIQYNKRDDELSISVRINFIHRPGSDLFIVINEERGSSTSIWDVNTRASVVKLTYLARL
ncbi:MAG: DUF5916 domain-containing protein [Gemmatimonadota bacterium]|nr:DUF5916 domain-containing protein [Gemmatimonadota bacterium]